MKRFTDAEKWGKPWFRKLEPRLKLLWLWLVDNCDTAGVCNLDLELAGFQTGEKYGMKDLAQFGGRVVVLRGGDKAYVPTFAEFQFGGRAKGSAIWSRIEKLLSHHGIDLDAPESFLPPEEVAPRQPDLLPQDLLATPQAPQAPPVKQIRAAHAEAILAHLNAKAGRSFRVTPQTIGLISARLAEVGDDVDGIKRMIDRQVEKWTGTDLAEYLRPETLFGKTKFAGYYDNRDLPTVPAGLPKIAGPQAPAQPSAFALTKQLEALQTQIQEVHNRGHEDAFGWEPRNNEDRQKMRELKAKAKEVRNKLANVT